jgi:hypothetical protein
MNLICGLLVVLSVFGMTSARNIDFTNQCGYDIWISPLTNAQGPPLPEGIAKISNGDHFTYQIPDAGW